MGTVNVQDNNLSLNFTAANDLANGVDLTAAATGLTTVAATVTGAGLASAAGVGGVLDGLLVNPDAQSPQVTDFLYALGSSSTAQEVTNKVAELLPLMSGSVNYATLNTLRMMNLAVNQRLDANAGVSSGDLAFSDKHFWLKPFGSWANQDKRSNTLGYDSDSYGLVFGADGQISDANTVGLAIAYARTDMDSDMINQKANINSYQGTLYGSHKFSDVTSLNYQVDLGFHDNSGRRVITGIGSAKSDYDSWSAHAGVSLAHSIALSDVTTFTPSIRADYSRIRAESYHEKGAGAFNLNVGSETAEELILGADGKLARSLSDKATAFANLGVGYDVINDRTSLTSSFAGISAPAFTTRGIDPSPWLMRGGLGVVGQATETLELSLRYDFEVRNDFDNQTASVKARWAF
jgi:outer membrane autotransporter protein